MSKQSAQAALCLGGENGLGYVLWPMPWLHLELHNVAGMQAATGQFFRHLYKISNWECASLE